MTDAELSLRLPPEADSVSTLLDALDGFAEAAALPPKAAHRLALVCEEVVANVAMHGTQGPAPASFVAVEVRRAADAVEVLIEDDGAAFDPLSAEDADTEAPLEEREAGGLGIHFIRGMARSAAYAREDGRNRLRLVLDATA